MSTDAIPLNQTIEALRPMVPAKDFALSERFYTELGFQPRPLQPGLTEMRLGTFSFLLQDYYVKDWADNFVMHMRVSDVNRWWTHIVALQLDSRYGIKTRAPRPEGWGTVAIVIDPSGVLWQISEHRTDSKTP